MSSFSEETYRSERAFQGKLLTLRVDEVALLDGRRARREIVEHPGAVAILAIDEQQRVVLVKQFRQAAARELWEIPAGTIELGEEPLVCAQRELQEETGLLAQHWTRLFTFYTAPGFCTEKMSLFLAQDLQPASPRLAPSDEQIEVACYTRSQVETLLSEFQDAKTLVALLWWLQSLSATR